MILRWDVFAESAVLAKMKRRTNSPAKRVADRLSGRWSALSNVEMFYRRVDRCRCGIWPRKTEVPKG